MRYIYRRLLSRRYLHGQRISAVPTVYKYGLCVLALVAAASCAAYHILDTALAAVDEDFNELGKSLAEVREEVENVKWNVSVIAAKIGEAHDVSRVRFIAMTRGPYEKGTTNLTPMRVLLQDPTDCFSDDEGVFTAPAGGVYVFSFSGTCFAHDVTIIVLKNGVEVESFSHHDSSRHWRECGQRFAIKLKEGDSLGLQADCTTTDECFVGAFYFFGELVN